MEVGVIKRVKRKGSWGRSCLWEETARSVRFCFGAALAEVELCEGRRPWGAGLRAVVLFLPVESSLTSLQLIVLLLRQLPSHRRAQLLFLLGSGDRIYVERIGGGGSSLLSSGSSAPVRLEPPALLFPDAS